MKVFSHTIVVGHIMEVIWNATDAVPMVGLPYFVIVPLHGELVNIILQKWEEYNCQAFPVHACSVKPDGCWCCLTYGFQFLCSNTLAFPSPMIIVVYNIDFLL